MVLINCRPATLRKCWPSCSCSVRRAPSGVVQVARVRVIFMKRCAESVPRNSLEQIIRAGMMPHVKIFAAALLLAIATASTRGAITLNQIETFSGPHAWSSGDPNPNPPVELADSGPLGPGDTALRVSSNGGTGPGGRLLVFNQTSWIGDYLTPGILYITADLRNSGTTPLSIRLGFDGSGGRFVTTPTILEAFSGWSQAVFSIQPGDLISPQINGGSDAAATMTHVTQLRILHSASAQYEGARLSSGFLVDNIRAVPEPGLATILGLAAALGIVRKR